MLRLRTAAAPQRLVVDMAWYDRFMQASPVSAQPMRQPNWLDIGRQAGADIRSARQDDANALKKQSLQKAIESAFAENKNAGGNESSLYSLIAQKTINIDPEFSKKYSELANSTRYSESQTKPKNVTLSELGKQLLTERRQLQGLINRTDFPDLSKDQQNALTQRLSTVDSELKSSDPLYFASLAEGSTFPLNWNVPTKEGVTISSAFPVAKQTQPTTSTPIVPSDNAFPSEIESKINSSQDSKRTGQMDDTASIIADIDAWALKTGKAAKDREVIRLRSLVDNKNKELKEAEDYRKYKEEKGRQAVMDERSFKQTQFTNYKDKVPLWSAVKKVENSPNDGGAIRNLFALYLKDLSGAGVTESERIQTTLNMLPPEKRSELVGWKDSFLRNVSEGIIGKDQVDRRLLEEISGSIDPSVLTSMIRGSFTKEGAQWLDSNTVSQKQKTAADPGFYKKPTEGQSISTPQGTGIVGKGGVIILKRKR